MDLDIKEIVRYRKEIPVLLWYDKERMGKSDCGRQGEYGWQDISE